MYTNWTCTLFVKDYSNDNQILPYLHQPQVGNWTKIHLPSSTTFRLADTAALSKSPCPSKASLSSEIKSENAFLSLEGPSLQLTWTKKHFYKKIHKLWCNFFFNYLPTFRIFPIHIQSIEAVLPQKANHVGYEPVSVLFTVDQTTVFISSRIIPSSNGQQNFDITFLQSHHFFVKFLTNDVKLRWNLWNQKKQLRTPKKALPTVYAFSDVSLGTLLTIFNVSPRVVWFYNEFVWIENCERVYNMGA